MKLLIIGSGSHKSGLSLRPVALGKQFSRLGWGVTMILPAADKYNNFKRDPHASVAGVRLVQPWQPTTTSNILNLVPYLVTSLVSVIRHRSDVVYLFKPTPISICGLIPKFLFGTPVIVDMDDLGSEVMRAQGQSGLMVRLVAACERFAIRHSTAVVVVSTYLESLLQEAYPGKKILVVSNGVDLDGFPPLPELAPRPAVYYFGVLNRLELVSTLLEAMPEVIKQLPEVRLTVAGGGSALPAARQLAADLGIDKQVRFTGWIEQTAIRDYVQFGDIAVGYQPDIPTVRAASLMKTFQYMALSSVPVVSDVGDMKLYVDNGNAGLVVAPDDKEQLESVLIGLLRDPSKRTTLAHQARDRAVKEYAWPLLARRLAKFMETLLETKGK